MHVEKQLKDSATSVTIQLFSSLKKIGIQELQDTLDIWLSLSQNNPQ
jgi:GTP-binding protein EngB required for normal cell division